MHIISKIRHTLFFTFILSISIGLFYYAIFGHKISIDEIKLFIHSLGSLLPLYFIIFYSLLSMFLPATPLMAGAGIIFGFKYGLLYTTVGGFASSIMTFYLSRYLGKDLVENAMHEKFFSKLEKYDNKIAEHGILTVLILRLIPVVPFNILNLILGVSRVSIKDYVVGTIVGLAPSDVLTVYFGRFIFNFFLRRIVSGLIAGFLLGITVFIIYKRKKQSLKNS